MGERVYAEYVGWFAGAFPLSLYHFVTSVDMFGMLNAWLIVREGLCRFHKIPQILRISIKAPTADSAMNK